MRCSQATTNATNETIERVYRLLAKRYHPDNQSSGDAQKFAEVHKAFEILSNIPDQESIWVCDQKWERSAENGTNQAQVERSRRQRNELDDNDRGYTGSSPPAQIVVSTEL